MEIKWLDNAKEDIVSVYNYYKTINPNIATTTYNSIIEETGFLANFPRLGKVEPLLRGLEVEFRSLVTKYGNYKIIYYIYDDTIFISHIWDCRQDPKTIKSLNI